MTPQDRERAALAYARRGWPVLILEPGGKVPNRDRKACPNAVKNATTDEGQIRSWLWRFPESNIGIACGVGRSPVTVQDVDDFAAAADVMARIPQSVPRVRTPRTEPQDGGAQFYFAGAYPNWPRGWGELRSTGLYAVAPPSVIDERPYEWVVKPNGPLVELPDFLVRPQGAGAGCGVLQAPAGRVPHHERHDYLVNVGLRLVQARITDEPTLLAILLAVFEARCEQDPPRKPGGIEGLARWLSRCDIAKREQAYADFVARWSRAAR